MAQTATCSDAQNRAHPDVDWTLHACPALQEYAVVPRASKARQRSAACLQLHLKCSAPQVLFVARATLQVALARIAACCGECDMTHVITDQNCRVLQKHSAGMFAASKAGWHCVPTAVHQMPFASSSGMECS